MIALIVAIVGLVLVALGDLTKKVLEGELRGLLTDWCERDIEDAARLLPAEIEEDVVGEWLGEVASLLEEDRLITIWTFTRRLPAAAEAISQHWEAACGAAQGEADDQALGGFEMLVEGTTGYMLELHAALLVARTCPFPRPGRSGEPMLAGGARTSSLYRRPA